MLKSKKWLLQLISINCFNLLGSVSKSNFWQYFNCVIEGNLIDLESKNYFLKN